MPDVICKQLKARSLMTEEQHQHIRRMLSWDTKNPFASAMANFYLGAGPKLVDKMVAGGADWVEVGKRNEEIVAFIVADKMVEASMAYGALLIDCMSRYWPDCENLQWKAAVKRYEEAKRRIAENRDVLSAWPDCSDGPPPAH